MVRKWLVIVKSSILSFQKLRAEEGFEPTTLQSCHLLTVSSRTQFVCKSCCKKSLNKQTEESIVLIEKEFLLVNWKEKRHSRHFWMMATVTHLGSRHSSLDLSAPTILQPKVQIPSTTSTLFQNIFELWCEKDESKQKEAGIGHILRLLHNQRR